MTTNTLMKGWMKYFVYYPKKKGEKSPRAFLINSAFDHQFSEYRTPDLEMQDSFG